MPALPIPQISARDAARQLVAATDVVLLDVREPEELELAYIEGALHIPMQEIPARLHEIDPQHTVICLCHLGGRSAYVAEYLRSQGYAQVMNLRGGIEAWMQELGTGVLQADRRPPADSA